MGANAHYLTATVEDVESTTALLLQVFQREHEAAVEAGTTAIEHMIRAGEALNQIKKEIPRGEWAQWLSENVDLSPCVPRLYMRFARYQSILREQQPTNARAARRLLTNHFLPRVTHVDEEVIAEMHRLRAEGKSIPKIADHLGYTKSTVYRWLNPDHERRRLERAKQMTVAGRRAVKRKEREAAVKRKGGQGAAAYAYVRKALDALQHALEAEGDIEAKREINNAMSRLYEAEDAIVKASKTGHDREVTA
jgi:transposase